MTRALYNSSFEDVEELRKRFEDFRTEHEKRTRLPSGTVAGRSGDSGTACNESGLPLLTVGCE